MAEEKKSPGRVARRIQRLRATMRPAPTAPRPDAIGSGALLEGGLRERVIRVAESIKLDAGGGATVAKVLLLADLIASAGARQVVEIGVYRGRLLLPLSLVLERLGGSITGIDPYSAAAAEQHDDHTVGLDLRAWPSTVDWDGLYDATSSRIDTLGVSQCCRLIRERSADAASRFAPASIDLLHVDGNHDQEAVEDDVSRYLPLVRPGGHVVLDDVTWRSVRSAYERLAAEATLVFQLYDGRGLAADDVGGNDFSVFRVGDAR